MEKIVKFENTPGYPSRFDDTSRTALLAFAEFAAIGGALDAAALKNLLSGGWTYTLGTLYPNRLRLAFQLPALVDAAADAAEREQWGVPTDDDFRPLRGRQIFFTVDETAEKIVISYRSCTGRTSASISVGENFFTVKCFDEGSLTRRLRPAAEYDADEQPLLKLLSIELRPSQDAGLVEKKATFSYEEIAILFRNIYAFGNICVFVDAGKVCSSTDLPMFWKAAENAAEEIGERIWETFRKEYSERKCTGAFLRRLDAYGKDHGTEILNRITTHLFTVNVSPVKRYYQQTPIREEEMSELLDRIRNEIIAIAVKQLASQRSAP